MTIRSRLGVAPPLALRRRTLLQGAISLSLAGDRTSTAMLASAGSRTATPTGTSSKSRMLLAYFSRAGENYYYGDRIDLEVGNTEVVAGMIADLTGGDVYRIDAADPYSDDYDATVARNVREQDADARPDIADPLDSIAPYDVVLLGSPIWNVRPPMIMATFAERFDFTGITVFPFVTYAVSGLGMAARDYASWCPGATIGEGLAVRGEEVQQSREALTSWLRRIGLLGSNPATPIAS